MRIVKTTLAVREMKLKESYTIAYETLSSFSCGFIMAETDSGHVGFGAAAPDMGVTGESINSCIDAYNNFVEPLLKNSNPFQYMWILEELKRLIPMNPSVLAMTDMLLLDLASKKADVPLYQFLGMYRKWIETSITIGIMPIEELIEKIRFYISEGFRIFKIKGGISYERDIEVIKKIREIFKNQITLRFDANQGYTVEHAKKFVSETQKSVIELLEQPTKKNDFRLLGKVSNEVPIPVMADESLMNLKDVFNLTSNNLTDMINIKLMKVGGIIEASHINSVAKAAKVEAMVGCMDEPEISISAGLHFALSRPNVIYADLDGFIDIIDDPSVGAFHLKEGILYPSASPGLGLDKRSFLTSIF